MATRASSANLAVRRFESLKDLLTQTRRHSYIASLLGIGHVVLAVNKMDLVGYDQVVFEAIAADSRQLAAQLGISHVACSLVSALQGDNLLRESPQMPWYRGASLLRHLEDIVVRQAPAEAGFRLPVQWVNRRSHDFRGFTGTVAAGVEIGRAHV